VSKIPPATWEDPDAFEPDEAREAGAEPNPLNAEPEWPNQEEEQNED
jgi:hypothetical protein